MTTPDYGERYLAYARAHEAKRRMDDAAAALAKAEDEWHQACIECDRFDAQTMLSREIAYE